ncbi:MAG: N-acylglucosamine 2-epimerase, partial [Micavibrio aeruginosavorus]
EPVKAVRRQDPHMHLLEACLFAHETWGDAEFGKMADEIVGLFQNYFFDGARTALPEDYTDELLPHPDKGHIFEPGHYCEWVWLLKKHAVMKNDAALHDPLCLKLLDWANRYGWDEIYGGIYDGVGENGRVIEDTKRIWPFCEALKANALMLNAAPDRQSIKDHVARMVDVFEDKYMQERGFWVEWLNRDLTPAADYMPGTTPYHVYFGIMETWDAIDGRGQSVSLVSSIEEKLYGLRRSLSNAVKTLRA